MSLRELDDFCKDFFGVRGGTQGVAATRLNDVPYYVSDSSLARRHWAWSPSESNGTRLERTCRWARENRDFIARWWGR
jgi:hypothetical protein